MKWADIFPDADPRSVRKFVRYHKANPQVFSAFRRKALEMKRAGRHKYSAWVIINIIRWDHDLHTSGDEFKINNDYIALYARLLMHKVPTFDGFFNIKKMKKRRFNFSV